MYEKFTSKLRKGYRVIRNSSRALRRYSHAKDSKSTKLHASSVSFNGNDKAVKVGSKLFAAETKQALENNEREQQSPSLETYVGRWQNIFDNDQYKNWLRVGLALRGTCDAVAPLVDKVLVDFHLELRDKYTNVLTPEGENNLIGEVLGRYRIPISRGEVWRRSDVNNWLLGDDGPWEIAKVFLPKGSRGSSDIISARSLDITGMLNLMTSFIPFENYVSDLRQVQRVLQIRNKTMHSPRLEFTKEELDYCFHGIQSLLQDSVLIQHLQNFPEYNNTVKDIELIKVNEFSIRTFAKSSFDLLEDRLTTEQQDDPPYPSALSSNRELLRSLRQVLSSGEVNFALDASLIEQRLEDLENLLTEQQKIAEEKMGLLFRKANYLKQQLDKVQNIFQTPQVATSSIRVSEVDNISQTRDIFSHLPPSENKKRRKRKKKGKNKGNRQNIQLKNSQSKIARKKSIAALKVKSSLSYIRGKQAKKRPSSVPVWKPEPYYSPSLSSSESKLLYPTQDLIKECIRYKSTSAISDGTNDSEKTPPSSAWNVKDLVDPKNIEHARAAEKDCDTPGPSGLQFHSKRPVKRKALANLLIPYNSVREKLMLPLNSAFGKKKHNSNRSADSSLTSGGAFSNREDPAGGVGGGSKNDGHFQQILRNILVQQSSSPPPTYEDRKEGENFNSVVRFRSKYAIKSATPKPNSELAEREGAAEALKKFGLEVADLRNAKGVLDQFCEAAVGCKPNYYSYLSSSRLYIGVAQIHSLFTSWSAEINEMSNKDSHNVFKSGEDIFLQVNKTEDLQQGQESREQDCARVALEEANILEPQILNFKRAVSELCLKNGGTLPIYETTDSSFKHKNATAKKTTTMTSYVRDKFISSNSVKDNGSFEFDPWVSDIASDDIVLATSSQPTYTQDQAEEAAAKSLLEKMGIVAGQEAANAYHRPNDQVLRENAVHWGYHPPQYHTFEVKPQISLGDMYFTVVSSSAFHKYFESMSAESDGGMTTLHDARESAARKALLMLGYPNTFSKR